jgi:tetratricopeptide (TPR) repeat protein
VVGFAIPSKTKERKKEGPTMPSASGLAEFRQGLSLLRKGHSSEAVAYLRRAAEMEDHNATYISFLGVSMARAQRDWAAAVELCKTALNLKRDDAQLYLNLAEVYESAGRRDIAVETLDSGLRRCAADARISRMRGRFEKRRSPILPFLKRSHFLNRRLGRLRHRLLKAFRSKLSKVPLRS